MLIRRATATDAGFLERMLLDAFDWRGGSEFEPAQVLADPAIAHYVAGWPRTGDIGVIAVQRPGAEPAGRDEARDAERGVPLGAAWLRYFSADDPGYGFVAEDVPELSMAVLARERGRGVGRALLTTLIEEGRGAGIQRVSLSVEDGNFARGLYESAGFAPVGRNGGSDTMLLILS